MTGRTVHHYEIREKLGSGGMGHVYKALDTRLGRFVAIKVLAVGASADEDLRRRFWQEARSASALNHPNIITIHDIVSQDGSDFLVMEYLDGKTLAEAIPAGGLPLETALAYAVQIAAALAAAHGAGIVHRDLKPGNIMVSEQGHVKLLDFGLAKQTGPLGGAGPALTVEGAILGTAAYMSPEQAEGKAADARSDVFSFGAILYEMLTGRRAFSAESQISTLTAVLRDDPPPIRDWVFAIPPEMEQLAARCLRKNPAERWQDAAALQAALAAARAHLGPDIRTAGPAVPLPQISPPSVHRSKPPAVVIAAASAAIVGGIWWIATTPARRTPPVATAPTPDRGGERPSPLAPGRSAPVAPAAPGASALDAVPPKGVRLPDGHPVPLQLETSLNGLEAGAPLRFTVAADIAVDGKRVIARGAQASGFLGEARKRFLRRRALSVAFRWVRAIDGQLVPLRATPGLGGGGLAPASKDGFTAYIDGAVPIQPKP